MRLRARAGRQHVLQQIVDKIGDLSDEIYWHYTQYGYAATQRKYGLTFFEVATIVDAHDLSKPGSIEAAA